jgi:hypothetical protein
MSWHIRTENVNPAISFGLANLPIQYLFYFIFEFETFKTFRYPPFRGATAFTLIWSDALFGRWFCPCLIIAPLVVVSKLDLLLAYQLHLLNIFIMEPDFWRLIILEWLWKLKCTCNVGDLTLIWSIHLNHRNRFHGYSALLTKNSFIFILFYLHDSFFWLRAKICYIKINRDNF